MTAPNPVKNQPKTLTQIEEIPMSREQFLASAARCFEALDEMGSMLEQASARSDENLRKLRQRRTVFDYFTLSSLDDGITLVFEKGGIATAEIKKCAQKNFNALARPISRGLLRHKKVIWIVGILLLGIAAYRLWSKILNHNPDVTSWNYLISLRLFSKPKSG